MGYLDAGEFAAFGLAAETSDALVTAASALVDAHCRRAAGGLLAAAYVERLRVSGRFDGAGQRVQLSYLPVAAVTGVRVRMAVSERAGLLEVQEDVLAAFFGPGTADVWTVLDVSQVAVAAATGEVTLPWSVLGARYVEAEVSYQGGYAVVPDAVKVAVAQVVRNMQAQGAGVVKSSRVDKLEMEYFAGSYVDETVRVLLAPYVAVRVG